MKRLIKKLELVFEPKSEAFDLKLIILLLFCSIFLIALPTEAGRVRLDMDNLPENEGWAKVGCDTLSSFVSQGILTIESPGGSCLEYRAPDDWLNTVSNEQGWVIETRMKVDPSSVNAPYDWNVYVLIHDKTYLSIIGFNTDKIYIAYPYTNRIEYLMDTTNDFHTYRIEGKGKSIKIFVDGNLAINLVEGDWTGYGGTEALEFGDGNGNYYSKSYWDYFYYNTTGTGTIDLPRTGQTTCYDSAGAVFPCAGTGQDGEIQAGVPWPDPRFTDNGDGTVADNLTGLMWTKDANLPGTTITWQQALDYAADMNAASYPNFGYTDWRLPNVNELESLRDIKSYSPALPSGHPFVNVHTDIDYNWYWTSNTSEINHDGSLVMQLGGYGYFTDMSKGNSTGIYVWPVRGGTVINGGGDTTPLTITCPVNQPVEATSSAWAVVNYSPATATDADAVSTPTITYSQASGTVFPLGTTIVTATATDGVGNSASCSFDVIVQDNTPPTITSSQNPLPNTNGWNNTDVTITFTATDAVSQIVQCEIVAMALTSNSPVSVTMNNEGASQTVNITCTDGAGNSATASHTVNIDKTAPIVTVTRTPEPNLNGWNNTDVTAHFTATDGLSGVQGDSFFDVFFTIEGTGQGATHTFTDLAGNTGSATISNINIDKTAPVITITGVADGSTYVAGGAPQGNFTAEDALSGIATSSGILTGGNSNGVGGVIYTATATDLAGNSTTRTANLSVTYNFIGFLQPINNDGSSVFKLGSTLPIKYQVTDCNGAAVAAAVGTLAVFKVTDAVTGTTEEMDVDSSGNANTDNIFRYADTNYIYNLSTKPYTNGTYRIQATLDDGTVHTVNISTKTR